MTTDIKAILARLERATGPDRDIDNSIYMIFVSSTWPQRNGTPQLTSSLDDALALAAENRPGCAILTLGWALQSFPLTGSTDALARAVLIALFRWLDERGADGEAGT